VRPINTNTSPIINRVTQIANQQLGKPYVWAKAGPKSFDCSGLVDYAYRKAGVNFPVPKLSTWSALKMGISVKNKPLQPGDMIITHGGEHMVMYMGNGRVISAPHTGAVVQHQPLSKFAGDIVDIRRIVGAKQTKWTPPRR
jgi:cell wall-associated NlpC family hydrolase